MRVAVSAIGESLDSPVSPRFGRCPYYVIVDTETMAFEAMPNASMGAPSGAGIAAAQAVAQKGVDAVITGNFGPNASQVLAQVGVEMVTGATGSVRQTVESYKNGTLTAAPPIRASGGIAPGTSPGMGMGGGMGMGRGMGRRMGRGRGMGRGMGMGQGMSSYPTQPTVSPPQPSPANVGPEKEALTKQLEQLERQLKEVRKRLEELR